MTMESDFTPKISVLIPFYQADEYFDECMNSVLNQSYKPDEIIIVNDNSGKQSEEYLKKYNDVATIIHLETSHKAPGARNIAVSKANNDWVAFQDADDIWVLNKLEKQVKTLQENKSWIGCHTGVTVFDDSGEKATYNNKPSPIELEDLLMGSHITPPSLLIKKEIVENLGKFDTSFRTSSDYEFSIRLAKAGYKIGFVAEPLIKVRRTNHGNVSSNGFRTFKNHLRLTKKHWDFYYGVGGLTGVRRFLGKSLSEAGGKIGGLSGRLVYRVGIVLSI